MSIVRAPRPDTGYLILSNDVARDERLSYRARGVLTDLLSRPDNWTTSADKLARPTSPNQPTEGRKAMQAVLRELRNAGYVRTVKNRDEHGQFVTVTYVYDTPQPEVPEGPRPEVPEGTPGVTRGNDAFPLVTPEVPQREAAEGPPKEVPIEEVLIEEVPIRQKTPKTPRRKPKTPLPDGWEPTRSHRDYAAEHGLDLPFQVAQFTSHAHRDDARYVDWDQAFWTWLRNAVAWSKPRTSRADDAPSKPRRMASEVPLPVLEDEALRERWYDDLANLRNPWEWFDEMAAAGAFDQGVLV